MSELVVSKQENGVVKFLLNRPEKRNALNRALIHLLLNELEGIEKKSKVLLLEGSGSNFCSGLDLNELSPELLEAAGRLFLQLASISIPTIAYVHGSVAAGGIGLLAACDLAVASPDATFFLPELKKGIAPLFVEVLLRRVLSERHFKEIALTGMAISANRALEMGLVNALGIDALKPLITGALSNNQKALSEFKRHMNQKKQLEDEFKEALKIQEALLKSM